ncbi:hypothetical protein B0O99DRAFT_71737 [Bisporella sp. PMI_857]|nr:hypothetical protein B0O99DRAFT_71737 [Bisporella sp. PMI_857]
MMSSSKKKVHYERGTKGGKSSQGHRSTGSRDSGVGSSSASDRASLGTSPDNDSAFSYEQTQDQRQSLRALREALDAANEEVRRLQLANGEISKLLKDSHKENRTLKGEKKELLEKLQYLEDFEAEKQARRVSTNATTSSNKRTERRTTPPKKESRESAPRHREYESSEGSDRRSSWREQPVPLYDDKPKYSELLPTAPQPPPNSEQNPFAPNPAAAQRPYPHARRGSVSYPPSVTSMETPISPTGQLPFASIRRGSVSYPPSVVSTYPVGPVTYATAPLSYTTTAAVPSKRSGDRFPNDGKYHPYPI